MEKAFKNIDTFNDKYRISKYVLDQDLATRFMLEKGVSVGINSPALKDLTMTVVQDVTVPTLETIVRTHEAQIRDLPYENCFAFADDGTIILQKSGTVNQIEISDAEGRLLKGTVFTHNHPGGTSFSMEDIQTGSYYEVHEIRATGKYRTYVMRAPDGSNLNYTLWQERGYPVFRRAKQEVLADHQRRYAAGLLTGEESIKTFWHDVWQKVSSIIPEYKYTWIDEQ